MKSLLSTVILFSLSTIICVSSKRASPEGKSCEIGWNEVPERIEYTPGSGQRILFPDAELQLCDTPCVTRNVSIRLSMVTNHIGKGCDRDTYSVESQRKLCGASAESVDLLPSPGIGTEWTRELRTDEGRESDQIYEFDGSTTAVVVPETTLNHSLGHKFSISLWMKHEVLPDPEKNKHVKEAILCNSDDHKKNRHHYSLFVRNCRLILLVRQEHNDEKSPVFKPAEWRWKLPQVCDNEWHHYSVSLDYPKATLFLDGQMWQGSEENPEVIDDWPLHSVLGVKTTLAIGACWQGRESQMNFHFRGFLAGLSLLRGRTEKPAVLSCLHRCQEGLQVPPAENVDSGARLSVSSEATVSIGGKDAIDVEDLLSQVSYLNSREFPTPGRRSLKLVTAVTCSDGKAIQVPNWYSYIVVLPPDQPSISLNGTANLAREYESFKQGIELFASVLVQVNHETEQDPDDASADDSRNDISDSPDEGTRKTSDHKLDACNVRVYPPLNADYESLRLPVNFMQHLGVHYKETKDGLVIHGADTVRSYQTILRQIVYFNRKPDYYLNRAFKLSCSELNGRFTSNDYIQTLTVIHPNGKRTEEVDATSAVAEAVTTTSPISSQVFMPQPVAARAQQHEHKVDFRDSKLKSLSAGGFLDSSLSGGADSFARTAAVNSRVSPIVVGHAVTVIIVVCVGFLVFMVVLGVIRIRAAHHRTSEKSDDEQEMAWDDTALTITVNPLDQMDQEGAESHGHDEEEESDSSGTSYHEDGESSEEDEPEDIPKHKSMAWDDSALNF